MTSQKTQLSHILNLSDLFAAVKRRGDSFTLLPNPPSRRPTPSTTSTTSTSAPSAPWRALQSVSNSKYFRKLFPARRTSAPSHSSAAAAAAAATTATTSSVPHGTRRWAGPSSTATYQCKPCTCW